MPENERYDSRPHFVIPYWSVNDPAEPGDDGDTRPLPSAVVPYLCPGIHASHYSPGQRLDVTVDIRNFGGANTPSQAQVTVWWADPTTGFVVDASKVIGFQTVAVPPRGGQATTLPMSKLIPATAPSHSCLLARVSHQYDRAGTIVDPVNDRHWAQKNLWALAAQPGIPIDFTFFAGNPLEEEAEFLVLARPVREGSLGILADEFRARPLVVDARLWLSERSDVEAGDGNAPLDIRLRSGERRQVNLRVRLSRVPEHGHFAAFEVIQQLRSRDRVIGGLGLAITRG